MAGYSRNTLITVVTYVALGLAIGASVYFSIKNNKKKDKKEKEDPDITN